MRITRYTDYSLRVLIYVALKKEETTTIREIAESYDISKNHLMKVVQELNNKNYLTATRGKNGGLRLSKQAEEINLGALIRDIEQDFALVECFNNNKDDNGHCIIAPACHLRKILAEALNAFLHVLNKYTLADLLPQAQNSELLQLLNIHSSART